LGVYKKRHGLQQPHATLYTIHYPKRGLIQGLLIGTILISALGKTAARETDFETEK